jgi:hypothetical protein
MENVTYFMLWRLQLCSVNCPSYGKRNIFHALQIRFVKRPNYGKRNMFHALENAYMLCELSELWET